MSKPDILDDIINHLTPSAVPTEFIIMAKVITHDGTERIVTGEQLETLMYTYPEGLLDVRIILDVRAIRQAVMDETEIILERAELVH